MGAGELEGLPLIVGGRSLGARVACRTAAAAGATAVLCLAFPVHPPGRTVVRLKGNHSLKSDVRGLRAAVTEFLGRGNDGDVD